MHNKKKLFSYPNQRKCIANLRTLSMHFRLNFAKYKSQKVMKVILKFIMLLIDSDKLSTKLTNLDTLNYLFDSFLWFLISLIIR